jgi:hypothetical protein
MKCACGRMLNKHTAKIEGDFFKPDKAEEEVLEVKIECNSCGAELIGFVDIADLQVS